MKLFVDTGSIKDIEAIAALGILDGVTTNPSLLAKEPGDFRQNLKRICEIVNGPVSGEVTATDFAGMMQQGHDIAKIDQHMVVKVPLTQGRHQGVQGAVGRRHPRQRHAGLLGGAGAAGGQGRRDVRQPVRRPARRRRRRTGWSSFARSSRSTTTTSFTTEVLVASCRHPMHIVEAARMGADICTCPPAVIEQLFNHPLTNIGLEKFLKDWEKVAGGESVELGCRLPR